MRLYFLAALYDSPAFRHVVRHGLLDVDVLAGLAGPDRHQGVPVIRGRDRDGVEFTVVDQFSDVGVGLDRLLALGEFLRLARQHLRVDVAERHDSDTGEPAESVDVAAATAAETDHRYSNILVAPGNSSPGAGGGKDDGRGSGGLEKISAIEGHAASPGHFFKAPYFANRFAINACFSSPSWKTIRYLSESGSRASRR